MTENGATTTTVERLRAFWAIHRGFDANMTDLARYAQVSRDTVYRWLNGKGRPAPGKDILINEWLDLKQVEKII